MVVVAGLAVLPQKRLGNAPKVAAAAAADTAKSAWQCRRYRRRKPLRLALEVLLPPQVPTAAALAAPAHLDHIVRLREAVAAEAILPLHTPQQQAVRAALVLVAISISMVDGVALAT